MLETFIKETRQVREEKPHRPGPRRSLGHRTRVEAEMRWEEREAARCRQGEVNDISRMVVW